MRPRPLPRYLTRIASYPAQTIVLSFLTVIAVGTLLLALPASAPGGERLTLLDSLFTATSAVCVTGLIVVDTATQLSLFGQIVVLVLIQIGGLGIMVISFFVIFVFRGTVSIQNRLLASYMLKRSDLAGIAKALKRIVRITLSGGGGGNRAASALSPRAAASGGAERLFVALFHAVSAFCNAGFSLFSNSLEGLVGNGPVLLTISALVIVGGLSFAVVTDSGQYLAQAFRRLVSGRQLPLPMLKVNTRVVLASSMLLLFLATAAFYAFEHERNLSALPLGQQYLTAFFQAVTLRTAGFNSIAVGGLAQSTLLFMMLFMFVGGASGSTAGGVKVNTLAVVASYVRSFRRKQPQPILFRHAVSREQVTNAFTVFLFGIAAVFAGALVLSVTENAPLVQTLFESVSAFATVGLSTGITGDLSGIGKAAIVVLMFTGRLGPLTIVAASTRRARRVHVEYPGASISIG